MNEALKLAESVRKSGLLPALGWVGIGVAITWATLTVVDLLLMVLS